MLMNMHWCTMFREHSFNLCWNVIMLFGCPCIHPHIILNFFRLVRQRRRWWWYRCLHSPGPHLLHAMTSAVLRQAEGSNPSSKALVNGDITFVTQNGWHGEHNQRWHFPLFLQVFIMCLTRLLVGLSACLRARENLWSGFRGRSRTTKVCQWWLQLVQVFQKKPYVFF